MAAPIRVLHVDDDPDFADLTATFLEREADAMTVETATSASEGLARLRGTAVDCVVTDYDMPGTDGIEFLETVREDHPDLPVILFTGKGSETVASDAISAGVTDYLQKESGTDQYTLLANKIENAVERFRGEQARERHLKAIETAREGISILDDDGEFIYVNEAYADLYGYDRDELLGEHWALIYPDDEVGFAREEIIPTVTEEGYWHGETTGLRADGSTFPEDHVVSLTSTGDLVCTVRDLTDRREREAELRLKNRAMDEAPVGITISDPGRADNPLVYANARFEELTGYDEAEVVGRNCRFLQGEDTREEPVAEMRRAVDAGESTTVELRNYRKDGTEFWNRVSIAPIRDDRGEVSNWVGFQEDVTERKQQERQLERQIERLDDFASIVSHDLRSPLNVATGHLEMAQEDCDSEHLPAIADALDRMDEIIEDSLTLARQGRVVDETASVSIAALARTSWQHVDTPDAELVVADDARIRVDPERGQRLFANLFRNAVEHGSTSPPSTSREDAVEHGGAGVTVRVGTLDGRSDDADGGAVGFYVEDDGRGLPPEEREAAFEAGYSTVGGSTGLGLTIVKDIAEAHGWEVRATESEAGGARFEFTGVERAA